MVDYFFAPALLCDRTQLTKNRSSWQFALSWRAALLTLSHPAILFSPVNTSSDLTKSCFFHADIWLGWTRKRCVSASNYRFFLLDRHYRHFYFKRGSMITSQVLAIPFCCFKSFHSKSNFIA